MKLIKFEVMEHIFKKAAGEIATAVYCDERHKYEALLYYHMFFIDFIEKYFDKDELRNFFHTPTTKRYLQSVLTDIKHATENKINELEKDDETLEDKQSETN